MAPSNGRHGMRGCSALVIALAVLACRDDRRPVQTVPSASAVTLGPSCDGAKLLATPTALDARGPWPTGVRTIRVGDVVTEVWYPARPGTGRGAMARYDLRTWMPEREAAKVPDPVWLDCACEHDLPIDEAHGPYPIILFLHGAAAFRVQSTFLAAHWASRGFITIAPDLPGVGLFAILGGEPASLPSSVPLELLDLLDHPMEGAPDPLATLRPHLGRRVGIVGHSLGAMLAMTTSARTDIDVRIALAGAADLSATGSHLVISGATDGIATPDRSAKRLDGARSPTRSAIVEGAGHLAFTDLCTIGADRGGVLGIARAHGVAVPELVAMLATDGCRTTDAPFSTTAPVLKALTSGVLEETLRCDRARTPQITALSKPGQLELLEVTVSSQQ